MKRKNNFRDYVNEASLRVELTLVNLKEEYKKSNRPETIEKFNSRKEKRIKEIKDFLSDNQDIEKPEKQYYESEIERLKNLTIETQNKELMGHYILLITKNLAKKSCFAGYTLNWKDEFFSRAIEHCFKYIHNFDEEKISERSGQKVKAFAYVTQIIYTAFLDVISKRKKEQERLSQTEYLKGDISLEKAIEKKSQYASAITLKYDTLDYNILKETAMKLQRFTKALDEFSIIQNELFLLSQNTQAKDHCFIENEKRILSSYERLSEELNSLKKEYKTNIKPEIIEIICNDYGDVKVSDVLKMFQFDNISCVITKNKDIKKSNDTLGDF